MAASVDGIFGMLNILGGNYPVSKIRFALILVMFALCHLF